MKKLIHSLIALVLILGMGACDFSISSGEDGISFGKIDMRPGFKATDQKQMEVLMQELDSAGVKYTLGNDGLVRYSPKDKKTNLKIFRPWRKQWFQRDEFSVFRLGASTWCIWML
jgi:flagellar biosynthesis/type III secretory pathway M-ring protein FliF/YscJ